MVEIKIKNNEQYKKLRKLELAGANLDSPEFKKGYRESKKNLFVVFAVCFLSFFS